MSETLIGLLHPGEMGAAVAACLTGRGYQVLWVPAGRGPATRARAAAAGLTAAAGPDAAGQAADLARRADIILSICPPHAALEVARAVAAAGFTGIYVDANAISPGTAHEVRPSSRRPGPVTWTAGSSAPAVTRPGRHEDAAGPGGTRLYLAGGPAAGQAAGPAAQVAALFEGTALTPVILRNDNPAARVGPQDGLRRLDQGQRRAASWPSGRWPGPRGWRTACWPSGRCPSRAWSGRSLGRGPVRGGQGLALGRRDGGDRRQHDLRRPARRVPPGRRRGLPPLIVGRCPARRAGRRPIGAVLAALLARPA